MVDINKIVNANTLVGGTIGTSSKYMMYRVALNVHLGGSCNRVGVEHVFFKLNACTWGHGSVQDNGNI